MCNLCQKNNRERESIAAKTESGNDNDKPTDSGQEVRTAVGRVLLHPYPVSDNDELVTPHTCHIDESTVTSVPNFYAVRAGIASPVYRGLGELEGNNMLDTVNDSERTD